MAPQQRHPLLALLLLTLVAGVLRFGWIDKPAIWGDEAATWRRICGTYQQMVDELRVAGFMPGNYVVTWWIKEGFPIWGEYREGASADETEPSFRRRDRQTATGPRLVFTPTIRLIENGIEPTPLVMRFLPALCGTLMVPAMYFLASRLVARRTALLVALFTCFSAYMLNYSRDAKMYMQFWLFATLHVGCLLWWLDAYRQREPRAAPGHMANDGIVGGVHLILPDQHINRIGDAFIAKPAERRATVDDRFPSRLETAVRWMAWITTGLAMIAFHAIGLGIIGIEILIFLATVPLRSQWIALVGQVGRRLIPGRVVHAQHDVVSTDTAHAASNLSPPVPTGARQREAFRFFIPPVFGFLIGCAAVIALWYSYKDFTRFYERVNPGDEIARMDLGDAGISWVEPYNEGRTIGGYLLYNASAYLMSWEWVKPYEMPDVNPVALQYLRWTAASLLITIGVGLIPWRKILSKKPADPRRLRGRSPMTAGFILACWLMLPAYGFYCASSAWTEEGTRQKALAPTQWIASWFVAGAHNDNALPLAGALGAELSDARRAKGWSNHDWGQLFVIHLGETSGVRWIVIGSVALAVLLLALDRWFTWREKLRVGIVALGLVAVFWLLAIFVYIFTPPQAGSIWMPRYLGFVWPAFAIAVCVLIRRLPFALVRGVVVIALVAANLVVFYHRVEFGEPRTDLMARDYRTARDSDRIRMFARSEMSRWRGAPGYGSMVSMPAAYYVTLETDAPISPAGAIGMMRRSLDLDPLPGDIANGIRVRLERDTKCDEFYLWVESEVDNDRDTTAWLQQTLAAGWSPAGTPTVWTVYDHWTWRQIYRLERHHWTRSPTTRPK